LTALDHALKASVPKVQAPPALHGEIMRAVRATEQSAAVPQGVSLLRWWPAPVLVAAALFVVWQAQRTPVRLPAQDAQSLAEATSALEMGGEMARSAPSAVVALLSDELDRLNRDLDKTAQFLLASLP